jgi:hypothetical protein
MKVTVSLIDSSKFFSLSPVQQEKGPMAPFLLLRMLLERRIVG